MRERSRARQRGKLWRYFVKRPTIDDYFCTMLDLVKRRSTCCRRAVGAILVDQKGHQISTGYNGVPARYPHCIDVPCPGASDQPGDNSKCMAIHAETNAIIQAGGRLPHARTLYCSASPCFNCCKLILTTSITRVVVLERYADTSGLDLLRFKHVVVELFQRDPAVPKGYRMTAI